MSDNIQTDNDRMSPADKMNEIALDEAKRSRKGKEEASMTKP